MKLWTYEELENTFRARNDLQDEDNFVGNDEMAAIFNSAIDEFESEVLKVQEDYLLTSASLSLVAGTPEINLPSNIYAQKIRSLIYANGPKIYPLTRFRDPHKFYKKAEVDYYATSETEYSYILKSVTSAQDQIVISPAAQESGAFLTLWYIRNANRIPMVGESGATRSTQLATVIDIPEAVNFLLEYARWKVMDKERDSRAEKQEKVQLQTKANLIAALTQKVQDNEDTVPPDMSFYEEMS